MSTENKLIDWMKKTGALLIPGEGGKKTDLFSSEEPSFTPYMLPPAKVESIMSSDASENTGGLNMDRGLINVLSNSVHVTEYADTNYSEITDVIKMDNIEATGETNTGGIIDSVIDRVSVDSTNEAEIALKGTTLDGQNYNFELIVEDDENGDAKYYIRSGKDMAELSVDQFVTVANNVDEKLTSLKNVREGQDIWTPSSFRNAWEQRSRITADKPYGYQSSNGKLMTKKADY